MIGHIIEQHYQALVTWAYVIAALLTLGWKIVRCLRYEKTKGVKVKDALMDYFFAPTQDNAVSWVTTLGLIWCIGTMYINRITMSFLPDWADDIPVRVPFAFFIGSLAEWIAPEALKALINAVVTMISNIANKVGLGSSGKPPVEGGQ